MTATLICPESGNPCQSNTACTVRGCWREKPAVPVVKAPAATALVPDPGLTDPIVGMVVARLRQRSEAGIAKYGTGLDRADLGLVAWLTHLQEELLDAACYVERTRSLLEGKRGGG